MSTIGTPPSPARGVTGDTSASPCRHTGATGTSGSGRMGNAIGYLPATRGTTFHELVGSQQTQATISPSPSLFSQRSAASTDSLSALESELEELCRKLSEILDSSPQAAQGPTASAPSQNAQPVSAAQQSNAPAAADSPYPDLGPNPFMENPTGTGPNGSFGFNPQYFPTEATANKIAAALGGKVVQQSAILNAPGSPYGQNQPNYMVELPNGRVINPGFIAQAIASGQPGPTIDAIIYSEVTGNGVAPGQAPPFVPANRPPQSAPVPTVAVSSSMPRAGANQALTSQAAFHIDQMRKVTGSVLGGGLSASDPSILALRDNLDQVRRMLHMVLQLTSQNSHAAGSPNWYPQLA